MFRFIARQSFIVNLLVAILLVFLLVFLFLLSLGWITNHGSYLKVPAVQGMSVNKAMDLLKNEGFEVVITDSAYIDTVALNTVKKQLPLPGANVKVNRTVFLNVNPSQLPMIVFPKLEGLSYRLGLDILNKNHLKLGDTVHRPDFMKGSILQVMYGGKNIDAGDKVRWGSTVDFVIGGGVLEVKISVPDLTGLTVGEAKAILVSKGIVLASIISSTPIQDTLSAYVYQQNPETLNFQGNPNLIQPGQTMDIWIQLEKPVIDSILIPLPDQTEQGPQPKAVMPKNPNPDY